MTQRKQPIREIIIELDNLSARQKYLSDQLIAALSLAGPLDEEDQATLKSSAHDARAESVNFVVTAAMIRGEQETGSNTRQLFRNRRASLRMVQ
ncbi:hypothetical protein RvVAT039_02470 [Agrobacterium vitis]|uniref:hypothetical protein n=1 Tax=Agrobacterium vitis TaxID=373 RepID=UPI0015DABF44|nr:hypothetical protein [Agrobacterium vitis]BCH63031.1 hypothetical protein RvVAT039_02470 [Agrobacterium vitis]